MATNFDSERAKLRQQLKDLNKQERIENARENRAATEKSMSPEQLAMRARRDELTAKVFNNSSGMEYLTELSKLRPIVHDEIMEAIGRHNDAAKQTGNSD